MSTKTSAEIVVRDGALFSENEKPSKGVACLNSLLATAPSSLNSTALPETPNAKGINQTVWRTVKLLLQTYNQPESCWEAVLPEALHAVRSLLCIATNTAPHERFLGLERRSMLGRVLPSWLI